MVIKVKEQSTFLNPNFKSAVMIYLGYSKQKVTANSNKNKQNALFGIDLHMGK